LARGLAQPASKEFVMSDRLVAPWEPIPPRESDAWVAALLGPLIIGGAVAVMLGMYGRMHEPTAAAVNLAGFSSGGYAKAWLGTIAVLLAVVQLISAAIMRGKVITRAVRWMPALHRWTGRIAVLVTVPVAVHCLYALGLESSSPRVLIHSLLGCAFYGAFVTKMLSLTKRGLPSWALPVIGAGVFAALVGLWVTSSVWLFSAQGLHF
jgi:uncharacterized protein DUF6529